MSFLNPDCPTNLPLGRRRQGLVLQPGQRSGAGGRAGLAPGRGLRRSPRAGGGGSAGRAHALRAAPRAAAAPQPV